MTVDSTLKEADHKMEQAMLHLREDLSSIRTGRASGAVLSRIMVEYYGTPVALNQLAAVNVPEPRLLVVQPFDKNSITQIEKAIQQSDLGITPSNDGQVIRLAFPPNDDRMRGADDEVHEVREPANHGRQRTDHRLDAFVAAEQPERE